MPMPPWIWIASWPTARQARPMITLAADMTRERAAGCFSSRRRASVGRAIRVERDALRVAGHEEERDASLAARRHEKQVRRGRVQHHRLSSAQRVPVSAPRGARGYVGQIVTGTRLAVREDGD